MCVYACKVVFLVLQVPGAGQSKDSRAGFGLTECLRQVTGRIHGLY